MDWKSLIHSRGFRDGLCVVLVLGLLASLLLPGGHLQRAQPEDPLEDGSIRDITVLKVGDDLSQLNTIVIPSGGSAKPGEEETEQTDPEETRPEDTKPEETESEDPDTEDGKEGQEDGNQGEEGEEAADLDLAMVLTWYKYGTDATTVTCAPSETVSADINTAQLTEDTLEYSFAPAGDDAKKIKITSVTVARGNDAEEKIPQNGELEIEIPEGAASGTYTFTVAAQWDEKEITFTYILEFAWSLDLELDLIWTKENGRKKTVSCAADDREALSVKNQDLSESRFRYKFALTGALAEDARIVSAEYRTDSGENGNLDKDGGTLILKPAVGTDTQTYHVTVEVRLGEREITCRYDLVYKETLDVQLTFIWFERGSIRREMRCSPGGQAAETVRNNQLSAGAMPYEISLGGTDGESGRIYRVVYASAGSGGGDLEASGSLPITIPEGSTSNTYTLTVYALVRGQELRFEVVLTFIRDVSLEMHYQITDRGSPVNRVVTCENGKRVQAEAIYTDQLEENLLDYRMILTGDEGNQVQITSVQCYQSGSGRLLTLEREDTPALLLSADGKTGENTFTVKARNAAGEEYTFEINIPYKPRGENSVKIETNLKDGDIVINETDNNLTVEAWSEDASGNLLGYIPANGTDTKLTVTLDGQELYYTSSAGRKSEYTLHPRNPETGDTNTHTLHIYAEDAYGNYGEKTILLEGRRAMDGQTKGSASVYVDLTVLGLGVHGPVSYTVLAEEPVSYVVAKAVMGHDTGDPFGAAEQTFGWSGTHGGTLDLGFYLESLTTGLDANAMDDARWPGDTEEAVLAEIDARFGKGTGLATLWRCLYRNGLNKSSGSGGTFGEFDYTSGSGWIYSVGGSTYYPGQSMSDIYLQDGDTLTLRYTLAYGWDVGGGTEGYGNTIGYCVTASNGSFHIDHRMETVENPDGSLCYVCRCCGLAEDCTHEHTVWKNMGDGTHVQHCEDCRSAIGDPAEHTWDKTEGSENHTCTKCDASEAHRWQEMALSNTATCTQPGVKTLWCVSCELEKETESEPTGHALANTWYHDISGHWQKCQTCAETVADSHGQHVYRYDPDWEDYLCQICEASHDWDYCGNDALKLTEATCLRLDYRCEDCGMETWREGSFPEHHEYQEGICTHCGAEDPDYEPHTHVYTETTEDAACTEDGRILYTCDCGDSYEERIPAAHSWGDWTPLREATEEEEGEEVRECTACGESESRTIDKLAHEHSFEETSRQEPTCTEEGSRELLCSCGETKTETLEATGHSWGDWYTVTEATEEEEGEEARDCNLCGKTKTRAIDKIVHQHSYEETHRENHTHTEDGCIAYACLCGDTYEEVMPAGHEWSKWKKNQEKGTKTRTCGVCGKKQTKDLDPE